MTKTNLLDDREPQRIPRALCRRTASDVVEPHLVEISRAAPAFGLREERAQHPSASRFRSHVDGGDVCVACRLQQWRAKRFDAAKDAHDRAIQLGEEDRLVRPAELRREEVARTTVDLGAEP